MYRERWRGIRHIFRLIFGDRRPILGPRRPPLTLRQVDALIRSEYLPVLREHLYGRDASA